MIRAGIIGCGRIADQHVIEILKMPDCKIVGFCDKEELMAMQMCDRFGVKNYFSNVHEFLETARPNTVHITTPPQNHFELGRLCLEADCNVMFEKPFALNTQEAEGLINIAVRKNLKITVDHNMQFNHTALKMREIINSGFLGGPPVHVESIWCYSYGDPGYAKALLGERNHWVRNLPGKLLHNIISHGVSKIAEFLNGDCPEILAYGYTSAFLKDLNEKDILDELRAIIHDDRSTTAYFTFSTQISPAIHELRIYGPKNGLVVDDLHQTVIKLTGHYKSYLNHFIPPLVDAKQYAANSVRNVKRFIKGEAYFEEGRRNLIERFYSSITRGEPVPIPYKEITLTSRIMDHIFRQLDLRKTPDDVLLRDNTSM
jgi:predicted dehydrogenase